MFIIIPIMVIIFIVVGIDYFYFSDTKSQQTTPLKEGKDTNTTHRYFDKFIKK